MKRRPPTLDLSKLSAEQRAAVERAIRPRRDVKLSLKFCAHDIARWGDAAAAADVTLTAWLQRVFDEAAKKRAPVPLRDTDDVLARPRDEQLSRRFPSASVEAWEAAAAAAGVSRTRWLEYWANEACNKGGK